MGPRFLGLVSLVFVLIVCGSVVIVMLVAQNSNDRASFKAAEQDTIAAFNEQYNLALQQNETWTAEPRTIALRYTCSGDCRNNNVTVEMPESDKSVIIVEDDNIFDDSIRAIKQRIEIKRNGAGWTLEWAGWKQQCRRDNWMAIFQGRFGWHTQLCP